MSKRRELEARRRQQEQSQMIKALVVIAVIVLVVVGGAIVLSTVTGGSTPGLPAVRAASKPAPPNAQPGLLAWGPPDAPIQVVEYLDYQCPACGLHARNFEPGIVEAFASSGKVRYEVKFFQIFGPESSYAAQAVLCAAEQDKAWQMHHVVFANQLPTGEKDIGNYSRGRLKEMAATIEGLNTDAFAQCLDSNRHEATVQQHAREALSRGVNSTPSFLVNGQLFTGAQSVDDFRKIFQQVAPNVIFQ